MRHEDFFVLRCFGETQELSRMCTQIQGATAVPNIIALYVSRAHSGGNSKII